MGKWPGANAELWRSNYRWPLLPASVADMHFVRTGMSATRVDETPSGEDAPDFRDAVIAGLRERGWPEHGLDDNDCVVWRGTEGGSVRFGRGEWGHVFEYGTADGSEGGRTSFADGVSPERVVEAIDRMRWVIGLPALEEGGGVVVPVEATSTMCSAGSDAAGGDIGIVGASSVYEAMVGARPR
jgi:hypothetical protein